jgi:UDP-N-acetylglucosamine kinase
MPSNADEELIRLEAVAYAKSRKKLICRELTNVEIFPSEVSPVSVFMAGSPGAGKTESSKELVSEYEAKAPSTRILRVDPDELRSKFPTYNGSNAWLFQGAVSILVDKMLDFAYEQKQSFILDGTLSDHVRARANIERCLKKGRAVQILYVYQDPILAWEFVQAREAEEGRRVPAERFIDQYFAARDVVNVLKEEFGSQIMVDLLVKPNDNAPRLFRAGIDRIDYHVPEKYDRVSLEKTLKITQS